MKLVFLISLPRAGSTLLQRLLMGHPLVASCGEPWLALPLARLGAPDDGFAGYGRASLVRSVDHVTESLPGGKGALLRAGGRFLEDVYGQIAGPEAEWFVDKTPRYYKILPELAQMCPDAKFIFLLRDPLSIYGSILNYIGGDLKSLPTWEQDIVEGVPLLAQGHTALAERSITVHYSDLVAQPEKALRGILEFMDLPYDSQCVEQLGETKVARGDPTGVKQYSTVSTDSLEGWKRAINSKRKRKVCLDWFERIDEKYWSPYNESQTSQLDQLKELRLPLNMTDELRWRAGSLYFNNQANVWRWGAHRRRNRLPNSLY